MHCCREPSQHPDVHELPGQQAVPGVPQRMHWPALQLEPAVVQAFPKQQGSPGAPHATQTLF
jgi:hypothetical protein